MKLSNLTAAVVTIGSLFVGAGLLASASDSRVFEMWNPKVSPDMNLSGNLQLRENRLAPKGPKRNAGFGNAKQNTRAAVPFFAQTDERAVNIAGCVLDEDAYGMYSYNLSDNAFSLLCNDEDLWINGGGYEYGGIFHGFNIGYTSLGGLWCEMVSYDVKTWTKVGDNVPVFYQNTATDLAADPTSGRIFGCFNADNSGSGGYVWGQFNPNNNIRAAIRKLDNAYVAVAADNSGQYYAIDVYGDLYKVAKETGEQTLVGNTEVDLAPSAQSAVFDLENGDLYWAAELNDGTTGLYTVDPANGRATLVNNFTDNQIMTGIFIPEKEANFSAPAAPSELTLDYPKGSTTGTVSFRMPSKSYGGEPLSGTLSYTVKSNDEVVASGTGQPGEKVNATAQLQSGYAHVEVSAGNENGDSPKIDQTIFIGIDGPKEVNGLAAVADSHNITIAWEAPTESVNGGYFDPASLVYTVVRYPDNHVVAEKQPGTQAYDVIEDENMRTWSYKVTAYAGDVEGETATSNMVTTGLYCNAPWEEQFTNSDNWDMFTVINCNNDRYTWVYGGWRECAMVDYDFTNPKDDWLITPPFNFKKGYTYKLEFMTRTKRALPETLEVKYGTDKTVEGMTEQLMEPTTIKSDDYSIYDIDRVHEFYITIDEDNHYYIGFHAMSEPQMNRIEIHYIKVTEAGIADAPAAITDLTAVPGANGQLQADVTFTTPSMSIGGHTLESLDKVEIYVNDVLTKTIDNPAVNTSVTVTVPTIQGDNSIMAKAYSEAGQGLEAKTTVYTGVVIPAVVTNLYASYQDGKIHLIWDAPTVGEDGGYVNPEELTYMVMRNDYTVLESNLTGTTFIDPLTTFEVHGQSIVSYVVYPRNEAGTGYGLYSNGVVLGDSFYTLPYTEGFPYGYTTNQPWGIASTTETSWFTTTSSAAADPQDGDNGMAMFAPRGPGESSIIYTGRFNLNKTTNPVISLWYFKTENCANKLDIQITETYGEFETLKAIDLSDTSIPLGWNNVIVNLEQYIDKPMVAFGFRGESAEEDWSHHTYIDNIQVFDNLDHNLELIEFDVPGSISFGSSGLFAGVIKNQGSKKANDYIVELLCNGTVVSMVNGTPAEPGESVTFQLYDTPSYDKAPSATYTANVKYNADQNLKNNTSDDKIVLINVNDYPVINDLTGGNGNASDEILLTWSAPEPGTTPEATVEDFESYIPFTIDNMGEWTLVDVDGQDGTKGITYRGNLVEYLNVGLPHAYQIFNPDMAGIGTQTGLDALLPHSGAQYLASMGDLDGENDDWLISPELSGDSQTISFWVKTPIPNYGFEKFEVLYSTTDKNPASFTQIEGIKNEAFKSWEEIAFNVPDGTKYFAIRHTSKDLLMIAIDDIRFIKKGAELVDLKISGYKVYRDGYKIADVPAATTTYTDKVSDGQTHEYAVTVNYEQGESGYSNIVRIQNSGIANLEPGEPYAIGSQGCIMLRNADGMNVTVASVDGKVILSGSLTGDSYSCTAYPGVYVVRIEDRTFKVYVK